jgi:hypothetical protein
MASYHPQQGPTPPGVRLFIAILAGLTLLLFGAAAWYGHLDRPSRAPDRGAKP